MHKHKLIELRKIIEERIGLLTNVKLNALYIVDRKDEVEFLQWTIRIIQWVLGQTNDKRQQLGVTKMRLELEDINNSKTCCMKKFKS